MFNKEQDRYVVSNEKFYQKLLASKCYQAFCEYPELAPYDEDTNWECVDQRATERYGCPYFRECPGVGFVKLHGELFKIKDGLLEKY